MSQYATFQHRIERIEARQQFVPEDLRPQPQVEAEPEVVQPEPTSWTFDIICGLLLFVTGILTVALTRFYRHLWLGPERADPTTIESVIVDASVATFLGLIVFALLKFRSPMLFGMYGLGATFCYLCMHMFVHAFPEISGQVFSLKWVFLVLKHTDLHEVLHLHL